MTPETTVAENEVTQLFGGTMAETTEKQIESMATFIAIEDDALEKLKQTLTTRKDNLDKLKADLSMLMSQNGIDSLKLSNGLSPKAKIVRKFFKAAGVDDDTLFSWLKENNLEDIIKPTVNFNTMQSTLKDFIDQGNQLPGIFNVSDVPTITLYGKSKFLANRAS